MLSHSFLLKINLLIHKTNSRIYFLIINSERTTTIFLNEQIFFLFHQNFESFKVRLENFLRYIIQRCQFENKKSTNSLSLNSSFILLRASCNSSKAFSRFQFPFHVIRRLFEGLSNDDSFIRFKPNTLEQIKIYYLRDKKITTLVSINCI